MVDGGTMKDEHVVIADKREAKEEMVGQKGLKYFVGQGSNVNIPLGLTEGEERKAFTDFHREQIAEAIDDLASMKKTLDEIHESVYANWGKAIVEEASPLAGIRGHKQGVIQRFPIKRGRKKKVFARKGKVYVYPSNIVPKAVRKQIYDSIMEDMHQMTEILTSMLYSLRHQLGTIDTIRKGGQDVSHMEHEVASQNTQINKIFTDVNTYMYQVYELIQREGRNLTGETLGESEENKYQRLLQDFNFLLRQRAEINLLIEQVLVFLSGLMNSMRKELAKYTLQQLEAKVVQEAEERKAKNRLPVVENVSDYDDLEGQNPVFDEKNNLMVEEGTEDKSLSSVYIVIGLLLAAFGIYMFLK